MRDGMQAEFDIKFEASTEAEKASTKAQITKYKASNGQLNNSQNKRPKQVGRMTM